MHAGFALEIISEQAASETLELLRQMELPGTEDLAPLRPPSPDAPVTTDLSGGFRNPEHARALVAAIDESRDRPMTLMEVCGTHTMAIAKNGLRDVMPANIRLLSGPGCPVCVTANADIDIALEMARQPGVTLTTFGDMMKVPGSYSSLAREKADGRDVRVVYSPLDALALAEATPEAHVVFLGVGFETTAPTIAITIREAARRGVTNFSVLSLHKTVPAALEALVNDPDVQIDGFILPGHVSTIIGSEPYRFLAERYGVPGAITGFEPVDVLQGVWMLAKQLSDGRAEIEIAYTRAVMPEGNSVARAALARGLRADGCRVARPGSHPRHRPRHPPRVRFLRRPRTRARHAAGAA